MEKDLLLGFTRTGCGLKVIRNKHLSMGGAKKTNFAPFGIFHALKLVFKTWAVNSNCYKNVFDLPWGPKIVHIHRHPAVETSLQSETRTQALRIYQCSRRHNYAQNSNTLCSISYKYNNNLTIENSNILIVCWLEATYQESYLVPRDPFQHPLCCGLWAFCSGKVRTIKHHTPCNLLFAKETQCHLGTRQSGYLNVHDSL